MQLSLVIPACVFLCLSLLGLPNAWAEEVSISAEQEKHFESVIRPIFAAHCIECHGPDEQEGEFRLDRRDAFLLGGGSGPVINTDSPLASRLIRSIEYMDSALQMPPDGKLPDETIDLLRQWVQAGAPWPADQMKSIDEPEELTPEAVIAKHSVEHWSYQPVQSVTLPPLKAFPSVNPNSYNSVESEQPIDRLVGSKLLSRGMQANERADRRTLINRAYFNLVGLPPTYEQIEAYLSDTSPDAFEKLIDQLLDNPHYGERWARHWLDIARYGDTTGYIAGSAETRYPYAFTFRDYVIDAFNSDKPYDQFIIEQIAADHLNLAGDEKKNLAAMGFLTVGRRFMNRQVDIIDDQIDVVSRGFLGLSVACARCHDHKYDAIPTADYYSLYGVLASSETPPELPLISDSNDSPEYHAFLEAKAAKQKEVDQWLEERRTKTERELQERIADYLVYLAKSLPQYSDGEKVPMQGERGPLRRAATRRWQQYLTQPDQSPEAIWHLLRYLGAIPKDEFASKLQSLVGLAETDNSEAVTQEPPKEVLSQISPTLINQLADAKPTTFPEASKIIGTYLETVLNQPAKTDQDEDPNTNASAADNSIQQLLLSGRTPATLDTQQAIAHLDQGERNRYNQLNNAVNGVAITHPGAPPRAMILQDRAQPVEPVIFKRGVPGNRGERVPRRFLQILEMVDQGKTFTDGSGRLELAKAIASPKNPLTARVLVNRIWQHQFGEGLVRSPSDFGIRGEIPTHPELLDYLAKRFIDGGWSIKKLQKEIMLSKTWQQSSRMRSDAFEADPENLLLWHMPRRRLEFEPLRDRLLVAANQLDETIGGRSVKIHEEATRRAIYAYIDREDLPGLLANFDLPSPDASRAQRSETTVPQQALYLMNSPFVLQQAKKLSADSQSGTSQLPATEVNTQRVRQMYRQALSRDPQPDELAMALEFTDSVKVNAFREKLKQQAADNPPPAWTYGYGGWVDGSVSFETFPYYNGNSWQFSGELPHPQYQYLHLTASGGHTGSANHLSPIRRWTAPADGTYRIQGKLNHPAEQGDGVTALLVQSDKGLLEQWTAHHKETPTVVEEVQVQRGQHLYLIVHLNDNTGWDSFHWTVSIERLTKEQQTPSKDQQAVNTEKQAEISPSQWDTAADFSASSALQQSNQTENVLDPWTQLAQALLLSNEFAFVD